MACLPAGYQPASVLINREGTPPFPSTPSTTFGYSSLQSSVSGISKTVGGLKNQGSSLGICIPQIESQIDGETINSDTQGGFLTSADLSDPTIISTNCDKTLYGNGGTGG
jgi:hypothetical protein